MVYEDSYPETARALYEYSCPPDQTDQLSLAVGDLIQIINRDDDSGWWSGTHLQTGQTGWFPASYVELAVADTVPPTGNILTSAIAKLNIASGGATAETVTEKSGVASAAATAAAVAVVAPSAAAQSAPTQLPAEWEQYQTEQGEVYYVNLETGESRWDPPSLVTNSENQPELPLAPPPPLPDSATTSRPGSFLSSFRQSFSGGVVPSPPPLPDTRSIRTKFSIAAGNDKMTAVTDHTGSFGYTNNFWSDKDDKSGFDILVLKHRNGKEICKDIAQFMTERAKIEDAYAKSLMELANNGLADMESGTMKTAWNQLKFDVQSQAKSRLEFSKKLVSQVQQPVMDFKNEQKKTRKNYEATILEDRRVLMSKYAAAQKIRKTFISRSADAEAADALVQRGQTDTMTKKDFIKLEENARKERKRANIAAMDYKTAVDDYEKARLQWEDDMHSACYEFQQAEENRIDFLKSLLTAYLKIQKQVNNDCKESSEMVGSSVDAVSKEVDIEMFVKTSCTGGQKPPQLTFERFSFQ